MSQDCTIAFNRAKLYLKKKIVSPRPNQCLPPLSQLLWIISCAFSLPPGNKGHNKYVGSKPLLLHVLELQGTYSVRNPILLMTWDNGYILVQSGTDVVKRNTWWQIDLKRKELCESPFFFSSRGLDSGTRRITCTAHPRTFRCVPFSGQPSKAGVLTYLNLY